MIETNIKNLSVQEIMYKIKNEVENRKGVADKFNNVDKLNIINKNSMPFIKKDAYTYSDFTKYHDIEFINNLYIGLLDRKPDIDGRDRYLKLLRSGKRNRDDIVTSIRYSKEGREKNITLINSTKKYLIYILTKIPLIGYSLKWTKAFINLPKIITRLNSYESYISREAIISNNNDRLLEDTINSLNNQLHYQKNLNKITKKSLLDKIKYLSIQLENINNISKDDINNLTKSINQKASKDDIEELDSIIKSKATNKEFELYMQSVGYAKDYMKLSQRNMQNLIDEAKKRLPKKLLNKKDLLSITNEEKHELDSFYIEFEDRFRGKREDIKERVEVYLPYIEELSTIKDNIEILDVGCGRGEWLELLKDNGYNKAKGLDLNRIMVQHSKELGLNVIEADVIDYLKKQGNQSLSIITGFHIIEHLPLDILLKLFEESYRVLKNGGMIIFETPNPENLIVGAYTFYTDPTHNNPLPFSTSEFLIQYSGFKSTEIKRVNYNNSIEPLENRHLNHYLRTSEDYSIIAYKV